MITVSFNDKFEKCPYSLELKNSFSTLYSNLQNGVPLTEPLSITLIIPKVFLLFFSNFSFLISVKKL